MLNQLADVYTDIASSFAGTVKPPDDYLESHERFFDALARRDADGAVAELSAYLERHDRRLLTALGVVSGGDSVR